jgi:hypothetical protein
MHRPLVPRIHAKSIETQGNAAKIVFVGLNGWQHRPKPPCAAYKRLPRSREFTGKEEYTFTKPDCAAFYSRLHDAVIRVYDKAGNMIETHEQAGDFKEW